MTSRGESKSNSDTSLPQWALIDFSDVEVGERIGGGGAGIIYKGFFKREPVALKTLFDSRIGEELKKEYLDELLTMSKLQHSNVVRFIGACMTPPNLCFVMEMCECSLYDLLHVERRRFTANENIQMAIDIASAMEYLHSLRPAIIHRDLKSLNILKSYEGSLKLCDFGLVANKNSQAGTPSYMANELFENRPFNKSVDVYAFGMVLWEILAQEVPFYQVPVPDIRDRVVSGDRPMLNSYSFPPACAELIRKCWHQRAEERPSFTEVVDELLVVEKALPQARNLEKVNGAGGDALDGLLSRK